MISSLSFFAKSQFLASPLKTPCHAFVRPSDDHPLLAGYPQDARRRPSWLILRPSRAGPHGVSYGPRRLPLRPQGRDLADRLLLSLMQLCSAPAIGWAHRHRTSLPNACLPPSTTAAAGKLRGSQKLKLLGTYRGRPENTGRNAGIGHMLADGASWTAIQHATGCSRATIAKVARRA